LARRSRFGLLFVVRFEVGLLYLWRRLTIARGVTDATRLISIFFEVNGEQPPIEVIEFI
jgi:hypothetical protein